jgi:hypothetical protein
LKSKMPKARINPPAVMILILIAHARL